MKTELYDIFNYRLAKALVRNGIYTVWDLKQYCKDYPFETMGSYKAICWKGIGKSYYEEIQDYFKKMGMELA